MALAVGRVVRNVRPKGEVNRLVASGEPVPSVVSAAQKVPGTGMAALALQAPTEMAALSGGTEGVVTLQALNMVPVLATMAARGDASGTKGVVTLQALSVAPALAAMAARGDASGTEGVITLVAIAGEAELQEKRGESGATGAVCIRTTAAGGCAPVSVNGLAAALGGCTVTEMEGAVCAETE